MQEAALKFIKKINSFGYESYIVGGFVRDYLLGIESHDIDIATNATPKEIKEIFEDSCLPAEDYGSVTVISKGIRFEITTFRKDISYINNRRPAEVKYIDNLKDDLLRRDFTINAICMDESGQIIDLLSGKDDIEKKVIRTIGDANHKFEEDCLRILRAVRFATILDFDLDDDVVKAIYSYKYLLKNLSYYRKKEELDKIFTCSNSMKGIKLLLDLGLDVELELPKLKDVKNTDDLIAVWSILNVVDKYPFTSNERELISNVNEALKLNNLDPMALYKYGLYVNSVAGGIKGLDKKKITESYANLAIHSKKDLNISCDKILKTLNKKPGSYLKELYDDLIHAVLYRRVKNEEEDILKYIVSKYTD